MAGKSAANRINAVIFIFNFNLVLSNIMAMLFRSIFNMDHPKHSCFKEERKRSRNIESQNNLIQFTKFPKCWDFI